MSSEKKLPAGFTLKGEWNGRSYEIVRPLGQGANGSVYLVRREAKEYALKIGADPADIQLEANVLAALSRSKGFSRFLNDVDDFRLNGKVYPFYVMKYIKGRSLSDFIDAKGKEWFGVVGLRLLGKLTELHGSGWVFGDLKTDNILVSGYGDAELVDFGGVTAKGRAVKQFTEIYDRSYWNAGSRTAEESYDLFAFAVLCLQVLGTNGSLFSQQILPHNRSAEMLAEAAEKDPECKPYAAFLRRALTGGFASSREAISVWRAASHNAGLMRSTAGAGKNGWLGAGFAASVALFVSAVYLFLH